MYGEVLTLGQRVAKLVVEVLSCEVVGSMSTKRMEEQLVPEPHQNVKTVKHKRAPQVRYLELSENVNNACYNEYRVAFIELIYLNCSYLLVNCLWGSYSAWSTCSVTCGTGTQTRTRYITTHEENGGTACSGDSIETQQVSCGTCPTGDKHVKQ